MLTLHCKFELYLLSFSGSWLVDYFAVEGFVANIAYEIPYRISDITEYISPLSHLRHLTRLTLSHNKLTNLPATISEIKGLESLNLFNNHLESLPLSINDLQVRIQV